MEITREEFREVIQMLKPYVKKSPYSEEELVEEFYERYRDDSTSAKITFLANAWFHFYLRHQLGIERRLFVWLKLRREALEGVVEDVRLDDVLSAEVERLLEMRTPFPEKCLPLTLSHLEEVARRREEVLSVVRRVEEAVGGCKVIHVLESFPLGAVALYFPLEVSWWVGDAGLELEPLLEEVYEPDDDVLLWPLEVRASIGRRGRMILLYTDGGFRRPRERDRALKILLIGEPPRALFQAILNGEELAAYEYEVRKEFEIEEVDEI